MSHIHIDPQLEGHHTESASPMVVSDYDHAMLEELAFVRREAQAEANLAYDEWRRRPIADAYFVYRASQDRADTAQDVLADWAQRIAACDPYWQPPSRRVVSRIRPRASQALP